MISPLARRARTSRVRRSALLVGSALSVVLFAAAPGLAAPTPSFPAPIAAHPNTPVSFDGTGSTPSPGVESLFSHTWNFGDGSAMELGASPVHVFPSPGIYEVRLTVRDQDASGPAEGAWMTRQILVTPSPHALVTGGTSAGDRQTFTFRGSSPTAQLSCLLDGGAWEGCTSPKTYSGLAAGPHLFSVRETGVDGDVQPIPSVASFLTILPALALPVPPAFVPSLPTVRLPRAPRVPRTPRTPREPKPRRPGKSEHQGPGNVFTPADVVVGARKGKRYGCEDRNPDHPENVSHCGWPRVTGMFFNTGETQCDACPTSHNAAITIIGTKKLNDMLLGGRGDVTIITYGGNNVLWADRVPGGSTSAKAKRQKARITAGDGNNIVYAGPGTNTIKVGKGRNVIHAWQGRGSVTCGSRKSVVRMMDRSRKRYKIRGCSTAKGY